MPVSCLTNIFFMSFYFLVFILRRGFDEMNIPIKYMSVILIENNIDSMEKAIECKELWDRNNGITLCNACHKLAHRKNK